MQRFMLFGLVLISACSGKSSSGSSAPSPAAVAADASASGPAGSSGAQGTAGTVGAVGPAGPAGPQGVAGEVGSHGVAGAMGPQGPAGHDGKTSSLGCYLQTTGEFIATPVVGCSSLLFSDGIEAEFQLDGEPYQLFTAYGNTAGTSTTGPVQCGYTSTDCLGTCYAAATPGNAASYRYSYLIKNVAVYDGSSWFRTTGKEPNGGSLALASYQDGLGACHVNSWTALDTFAVTTTWTPPVTLTLPLGPLYLGTNGN